jgi:endonuclease/exonuclease/phosphatase family metal-dependent hydrolase
VARTGADGGLVGWLVGQLVGLLVCLWVGGVNRLRVVTYNIEFGGSGRLEPLFEVLRHVGADVMALTEADDPALVSSLASRLDAEYVWAPGSGDRHIATLSRRPIATWEIYNTPPLTQAILETRVRLGSDAVTVFNVHLRPRLLLPFEVRRWQTVGHLLWLIRARQPGPHLIVGDLNAAAPGDRVLHHKNPAPMRRQMALQLFIVFRLAVPRLLRAGYVDCFRRLNPDDPGLTFMPANRTTRYDYILADPQLAPALRACWVVDDIPAVNVASDHLPVAAEFEINSV